MSGVSSGELVARFDSLARLKLHLASDGVHGVLELLPPAGALSGAQLAAAARFVCAGAGLATPPLPLPAESVDVGCLLGRWSWPSTAEALCFLQVRAAQAWAGPAGFLSLSPNHTRIYPSLIASLAYTAKIHATREPCNCYGQNIPLLARHHTLRQLILAGITNIGISSASVWRPPLQQYTW